MKPQKRQFGRHLAKALGEGPGPRAVEAQKARLVAEAERQRRVQRRWLVLFGAVALAALGALYRFAFR